MWHSAKDSELAEYFEHTNIWSTPWSKLENHTAIINNADGTQASLQVWEIQVNGKSKIFGASEMSNGVWSFALPKL
jgi:hypothetical protein